MEEPTYYAIIPANVRYDKQLKDKAKLLYGEITSLSNKKGYCYASNKYFAELYEVSGETISRLISDLENKGYLERQIIYKTNTKEIDKRILIPIDQKINTYCQNNQEGIDQNVKDNNTSINNKDIYSVIEEELEMTLSPMNYEKINNLIDKYGEDKFKSALETASNANKKSLNYIEGILKNKSYKPKKEIKAPSWLYDEELNKKEDDLTDEEQRMYDEILEARKTNKNIST